MFCSAWHAGWHSQHSRYLQRITIASRASRLVIYVLAATYVVAGFSNVGVVNFRKDLQFRSELRFMLSRRLVTFVVTVGCAVLLRNYWALVAGIAVGRLASVMISFVMSDYRPSLTLCARRELFHFSKWLLINNALYFMIHSGPNFVIGKLSGASGLGIYSISYEISNLPSTELVAPINRVTFPGFSKMKDLAEMEVAFLRIQGMIGLLNPAGRHRHRGGRSSHGARPPRDEVGRGDPPDKAAGDLWSTGSDADEQ